MTVFEAFILFYSIPTLVNSIYLKVSDDVDVEYYDSSQTGMVFVPLLNFVIMYVILVQVVGLSCIRIFKACIGSKKSVHKGDGQE